MNYQKNWSDLQKHNIAQSVRGYKVKNRFVIGVLVSVIIGLVLGLVYLSIQFMHRTDTKAQVSFQKMEVVQPIKTSSHRLILQGE